MKDVPFPDGPSRFGTPARPDSSVRPAVPVRTGKRSPPPPVRTAGTSTPGEKQGFVLPMGEWLRTRLRDTLRDAACEEQDDGLDNRFVNGLVQEHLDGEAERTRLLYAILMYRL